MNSAAPGSALHSTAPEARLPGFDVVRAVALIGVVVMNYHGFLNGPPDSLDRSFGDRLFDYQVGPLSTRFAATFVTVAGIGVVLMTNRSRLSGDRAARREDRWRLIRRGVLLVAFGFTLEWVWPGTILFFYGAYFVTAAAIFTWRIRWLALVGVAAVAVAYGIQAWRLHLSWTAQDPSWWTQSAADRSYTGLALDLGVNGTHPLFPWLAFFITGMIIGRLVPVLAEHRRALIGWGVAAITVGYATATLIDRTGGTPATEFDYQMFQLGRTDHLSRMPLYVLTTWGSSVVAVLGISWLADRMRHHGAVDLLRRAGQMTLSLYVLHVLVFNEVVEGQGWVTATGLDTALGFAFVFWVFAVAVGAWWSRFVGRGPLEYVYRRFGG
jgi:uncharacterized membrane protein YeiB